MAGLAAARDRGRIGGRPFSLTTSEKRLSNKMRGDGAPMTEIAEVLNVARSTSVPELAVRKQLCRDSAGSRLPKMLTELFGRVLGRN